MVIKPSSAIRNNYRQVADYCIQTGQPIFLTNNGEGELVVMSIQAWQKEQQRAQVEEALLRIEAEEASGISEYMPAEEVISGLRRTIEEVKERKRHEE